MSPLPIVLLPGLDGTGDLFAPLVASAPPQFCPIVLSLPDSGSYDELTEWAQTRIPESGSFAILGESFSGPLALRVASANPSRVAGVILCNSFVAPPLPALLRFLPWSLIFVIAPPAWVIRRFFVGARASPDVVSAVRSAIAKTPRRILAARMKSVLALEPLPRVHAPVLDLRGSDDVMVTPDVDALRQFASDVTHQTIAAPHLMLQVAPVEAWRAIAAHFERRDA